MLMSDFAWNYIFFVMALEFLVVPLFWDWVHRIATILISAQKFKKWTAAQSELNGSQVVRSQ